MKPWFDIYYVTFLVVLSLFVGAENALASPPVNTVQKHGPKPVTLVVTPLADSGPGSLREALSVAGPGDTITFGVSGTIFLSNGDMPVTTSVEIAGPWHTKLM